MLSIFVLQISATQAGYIFYYIYKHPIRAWKQGDEYWILSILSVFIIIVLVEDMTSYEKVWGAAL